MRRAAALLCAGAAAVALAGCGADYPDLMLVERTGSLPDARLTLLVNDGGTARCDGGAARQLAPELLLEARDLAGALAPQLSEERVYPRPAGALLRFRVETQDGSVTFSDVDGGRSPELAETVAFTRRAAREHCGLAR